MSLTDFKPMQERCSNCSYCKWIPFDNVKSARFAENCPSVCMYNYNTYSARGRFQAGLAIVNEGLDYDERFEHVALSCLDCGSCDVSCKICRYNLEPLEHNRELKHDALIKGHATGTQKEIITSLKDQKTMMRGYKKADRKAWAEGISFAEDYEVLYFPGCRYSYDEKYRKTARQSAEILINAGVKLGYLGDKDMCCAGRAYQMGYFEDFDVQADSMIKAIRSENVKTIVTPCSDCYYSLKRLYSKKGLDVEVLHVVEYLDRLIKNGMIRFNGEINKVVTYHDPCHLGRQGEPYTEWNGQEKKILNQIHTWEPRRPRYNGKDGIYDAPRDILKAIPGLKLVEMERIREYSWCCGAGSCINETNTELSEFTAKERVAEAEATGAEILVTACPWCRSNLESAGGMEVADILDLVKQAM